MSALNPPEDYAYAVTTVNASYTAGAGSLTVVSTASPFPQTQQFHISIFDQNSPYSLKAMLKVNVLTSGTVWGTVADGLDANCAVGDIVMCSQTPGAMDQIRADIVQAGVAASLPSTSGQKIGNLYLATDTFVIYRFNGSSWTIMGALGETLLESHSASSSVTIDFTAWYSAAFKYYKLRFEDVVPAITNTHLQMQFGSGGGPTWDTGANYDWMAFQHGTGGTFNNTVGGDSSIRICHDINTAVANIKAWGWVELIKPASAADKMIAYKSVTRCSDGNRYVHEGGAYYLNASPYTAIRLKMSSGNIASGDFSIWAVH